MNLERLKSFYRVAKVKSFTKAAEIFYITPGALSKSVKNLEDELQVQLFTRLNNVLELTEEGQRLFEFATQIMKQTELAEDSINDALKKNAGEIELYSTQGFSTMYLSKYMHDFLAINPDIILSIKNISEYSRSEFLSSGIAIHPYIENLKGYDQIFLTNFTFKLYASKEYLNQYGTPKTIHDLDNHRLISYSRDKSYKFFDMNWHLKKGCEPGTQRQHCIEVDGTFGRCRLAANNVGIISVPKEHPEIQEFDLVEILPDESAPAYAYYIIVDKVLKKYKRINTLIDFLLSKHQEV